MYKKELIEAIYNEQDKEIYIHYPLGKLVACLEVVDEALLNLETTIKHIENLIAHRHLFIYGRETAITIDRICKDYNIYVGAEEDYQLQESQEKVLEAFPLGDLEGFTIESEEFGEKLGCEEYSKKLRDKVKMSERSGKERLEEAVCLMRILKSKLNEYRDSALDYITQQGYWENYYAISVEVDTYNGVYWEVVLMRKTGKCFKMPSDKKYMEKVLKDDSCKHIISISRLKDDSKEDLCCGVHVDWKTVYQAMEVIRIIVGEKIKNWKDREDWIKECQENAVLQTFIRKL